MESLSLKELLRSTPYNVPSVLNTNVKQEDKYTSTMGRMKHGKISVQELLRSVNKASTCYLPSSVIIDVQKREYKDVTKCTSTNEAGIITSTGPQQKNPTPLECEQCEFKTEKKSNLQRHVHRKHGQQARSLYKCNECDYQTMDKSNLRSHLGIHEKPGIFKCDMCNFKTTRTIYFKRHYRRHKNVALPKLDPNEVFNCDQCSYQSNNKFYLQSHVQVHMNHENMYQFKCDYCEYKTIRKYNMVHHLYMKHNIPKKGKTL